MKKNIKNIQEDEKFRISRIYDNITRLKVIAKVFITIEIWFGVINMIALMINPNRVYKLRSFLIAYISFIIINIFYLIFFRKNYTLPDHRVKTINKHESIISTYMNIAMTWGSIISLMDQEIYGHLMLFMMTMLTCSCFFFMNNKQALNTILLPSAILLIGLPFVQKVNDILVMRYYNLCIFIPIAYLVSRVIYKAYLQNYEGKHLLEREIELNQQINQQLENANRMLSKLASIDELTGIYNRRGFNNYINMQFENHDGDALTLTVILIDIDYFKEYNDYYGHSMGDEVLNKLTNQINAVTKDTNGVFARWGGEEFIYTSFYMNHEEATDLCKKIREGVLALKIFHESSSISEFVTVSLGVSICGVNNGAEVGKCIQYADKALYSAKHEGRNCYQFYTNP